ncbi:unnamed protein product [Eretmochelys imbricata]
MEQEWTCFKRDKQKSVVESPQGPTAESIWSLWVRNPEATMAEYLSALEGMVRSTESGEDGILKLLSTHQEPGENNLSIWHGWNDPNRESTMRREFQGVIWITSDWSKC